MGFEYVQRDDLEFVVWEGLKCEFERGGDLEFYICCWAGNSNLRGGTISMIQNLVVLKILKLNLNHS